MFQFNLLVTYAYDFLGARREAAGILSLLGDDSPTIRRTLVKGVMGILTFLDAHQLHAGLRKFVEDKPNEFWFTQRWIPVDVWTTSDVESMKEGVKKVAKIDADERWMMVVEKRRYDGLPTPDIIKELAELIEAKVDLKKPDKIVRIDILGPYAGISLLRPGELFSALRRGTTAPPK